MSSISEEFKDQKINQMLEDYVALDKQIQEVFKSLNIAIEQTPSRFDAVISSKIDQIIKDCLDVNQELKTAVNTLNAISEKEKLDVIQTGNETKEKILMSIHDGIAILNRFSSKISEENNAFITSNKKQMEAVFDEYKKQITAFSKQAAPISLKKALAICTLFTVVLSGVMSGAAWFALKTDYDNRKVEIAQFYDKITGMILDNVPDKKRKELTDNIRKEWQQFRPNEH